MSLAVFLRGVNVGGHKAFRPSAVAKALARWNVVSIGAAGTFVVGADVTAAAAREAFAKAIPFDATILVRPAREITALVRDDPFRGQRLGPELKGYVTVLERRPRSAPRLPLRAPEGDGWQVSVIAVRGSFALSLHRRGGRALVYPNEVIEKRLDLVATTRNWSTIQSVARRIEAAGRTNA